MNILNRQAITHLADAYAWGVINSELQHLSIEKALIHLLFTDLMVFGGLHKAVGFELSTRIMCLNANNVDYDPDPKNYTVLTLRINRAGDRERMVEVETLTIVYKALHEGIHQWWYGSERPDNLHVLVDAHWTKFFYDVVHWYEAAADIRLLTGKW